MSVYYIFCVTKMRDNKCCVTVVHGHRPSSIVHNPESRVQESTGPAVRLLVHALVVVVDKLFSVIHATVADLDGIATETLFGTNSPYSKSPPT